jgi:hypothetical protein
MLSSHLVVAEQYRAVAWLFLAVGLLAALLGAGVAANQESCGFDRDVGREVCEPVFRAWEFVLLSGASFLTTLVLMIPVFAAARVLVGVGQIIEQLNGRGTPPVALPGVLGGPLPEPPTDPAPAREATSAAPAAPGEDSRDQAAPAER